MAAANGSRNGLITPAAFPPPVNPVEEFVGPPTDPEDERIEVGVAIVGGGPAGLACANRLLQLLAEDEALAERLGEVPVAVVEKGKVCGAHNLSGAIMRPSAMTELFPDVPPSDWPTYGEVPGEAVYLMLNGKQSVHIPTPPPFKNHANYVVSVAELSRWLAEKAEEAGAYVLTETSAAKLLVDENRVVGIRSGDKGRDKDGEPLGNFEPGSDVLAKATVLAEGTWGHLTGAAIRAFDLGTDDAQVWALGVKEVWEVPTPLTKVIHTLGWPLRTAAKYKEFGGSWIYPMGKDKVSLGFVAGLDYADVEFSVHDVLQQFKTHPRIRGILEGGKRIAWGAKAIPEGGYWAMPKLTAPGAVICGDAGGMVNVPELKGIHYAMHSGILAAEHIYRQLKASSTDFSSYDDAVHDSVIGKDMFRTRNMKQPFSKGFFVGGAIVNAMVATKGRIPGGHWKTHPDKDQPMFRGGRAKRYPKPDGKYTFDKLSSVYITGNETRDDAPNHIRVQKEVPRELAEMWQWMCPAGVYEVPEDAEGDGPVDVIVNYTNCVQCGAITAKGGRLTAPEGGDGPLYQIT
ncbi:MAG TPA: electron-transfer flavoprotein:ubiquinone oxidoreductase [Solirubrobacteraceae bacterium]|jgi:electron-transferring-flavoprotein dehydrogenase|nr:electron-transfer flavoprotein:ubiquinone oxidoreductase [Solirubrobacteraceae bacterium]